MDTKLEHQKFSKYYRTFYLRLFHNSIFLNIMGMTNFSDCPSN